MKGICTLSIVLRKNWSVILEFRCTSTSSIELAKVLGLSQCEKYPDIGLNQSALTCSKLTIETLEQGVKHAQS